MRAAIDIGGTFTDIQVLDERDGRRSEFKLPTTPEDPSVGLIEGIAAAAAALGQPLEAVKLVVHGTTIATNAVLERRFPDCALVTTRGFEDVLEIGRHMRRDVYGLHAEERSVLLPRNRRFGVSERIGSDGAVLTPLDEDEVRALATRIAALGVKVVAVCTLHAYTNGAHERRLRELLLAADPAMDVSLSSEVSPEIREYERLSTTVLNALLMPAVRRYMAQLEDKLRRHSMAAQVLIVQSNGGVCSARTAAEQPVRLILSGPSGGAMAVEQLSERLNMRNLVGIDMGGTSFDVVVVHEGRAATVTEGSIDGVPVRLPMIEMRTIGTGGGSIAWIDRAGRLRVGPRSAGARPGPACYARGGDQATVTDANLVLGRIDARRFAAGRMPLDAGLAREAVARNIATPLGLGVEEAAEGILRISIANMAQAIRLSLFGRGLDPADFALVSFGGAGGLHAAEIAEEVGVATVVYPMAAATFSAFGILSSDIAHSLVRTRVQPLTRAAAAPLAAAAAELRAEADRVLAQDGVPAAERRFAFALDLRYSGQGYELTVPVAAAPLDAAALAAAAAQFHEAHGQRFAHADPEAAVESVALRLTATGLVAKPLADVDAAARDTASLAPARVFAEGAWSEFPVCARAGVPKDAGLAGPALVIEDYSSLYLPVGWRIAALPGGDLIARRT
jgi:N-methylhydantoinase A